MLKKGIYLFLVSLVVNCNLFAGNDKLKVLVIVNGENPLRVELNNTPVTSGGVLGVLISASIMDASNNRNSEELQKLNADFTEYKFKHTDYVAEDFSAKNNNLDITCLNRKHAYRFFTSPKDFKLDYDKLLSEGWESVIVIDEELGFFRNVVTVNNSARNYYVYLSSEVYVFDVVNKKRLGSFKTLSFKNDKEYTEEAIKTDNTILSENYLPIYTIADRGIYNRLLGADYFHKLAKSQNLEAVFPSVKTALKKYTKSFKLTTPEINGWRSFPTNNDLLFINAPRKDKTIFSVNTEIDFAIEELGQKDLTTDEYAAITIKRLSEVNLKINTTEEIPTLAVGNQWVVYMVDVPNGKNIVLQTRMDDYFVSHYIVVLKEDYKELLNKYKTDVEYYINNTILFEKPFVK